MGCLDEKIHIKDHINYIIIYIPLEIQGCMAADGVIKTSIPRNHPLDR